MVGADSFKGKGQRTGGQNDIGFWPNHIEQVALLEKWDEAVFVEVDTAASSLDAGTMSLERIRHLALRLADEFKQAWPNSPILLMRSPDRANTFLRWRLRFGANRGRIEIYSEAGQSILADQSPSFIDYVYHTEAWRIRLNFSIAVAQYSCARLQDFVRDLKLLDFVQGQNTSPE